MKYRIPLPLAMRGRSIMEGTAFIQQNPFLDGIVGFDYIVLLGTISPKTLSPNILIALVVFDRPLELDERVLLRLKYDAAQYEFDTLTNMKRFNIAEPLTTDIQKENDHSS